MSSQPPSRPGSPSSSQPASGTTSRPSSPKPPNFEDQLDEFEEILRKFRNEGDPITEFTEEFDNMLKSLRKYEDTKVRLANKQKSIETSISSKREKSLAIEKAIADVQKKKERLGKEIKSFNDEKLKITLLVEKANRGIATVNEDVSKLQEVLNIGPGLTADQKKELKLLNDKREQLQRECDAYTGQLVNLRMGTKQQMDILLSEQEAKASNEHAISDLKKKNNDIKLETKKAQRRKDKLDDQLQRLNKQLEDIKANIQQESDANIVAANEVADKVQQFGKINSSVSQYVKANDDLLSRMKTLKKELIAKEQVNQALGKQNAEFEKALSMRKKEVRVIAKDTQKMVKLKNVAAKKSTKFNSRRVEAEDEKAELQANIRELQAAIEDETKSTASVVRMHATYERQREIMSKNLRNEGDATNAINDLVVVTQNEIKNLENELRAFRDEAVEQRQSIESTAVERDKYEAEATHKNQKYYAVIEDVKLADMEVVEVQKQIIDVETKLKSQQNMYEAVRSDRNLYSKNLLEAQEQVVVMKRKWSILSSTIQQLKQEIVSKDHSLVKEHFAHHRVENEIQMLRNDLTRIRKQIQSSEQIINNQVNEIRKLLAIINDAEAEKERQKKEHAAVIAERDTLGANLVKRNNEVNELYEKIKIVRSTLSKGEWKYDETLDDCDYLREEIDEAYQIVERNKKAIEPLQGLKDQVVHYEKQIRQEQYKVTALAEEIDRPIFIHRWRRLEGSDPKRFALIQKIQTLQKRLVKKSEEVVMKQSVIKEQEKLYVELKNVLARQPGPEIIDQLSIYQKNLRAKQQQYKKMENELEIYRVQTEELKAAIEQQHRQMMELKDEYFRIMRDEQRRLRQAPQRI